MRDEPQDAQDPLDASPSCQRLRDDDIEVAVLDVDTAPPRWPSDMSSTEIDIVSELIKGRSAAEIAERRGTSPRTIANQLRAMYERFGVSGRSELIVAIYSAARSD